MVRLINGRRRPSRSGRRAERGGPCPSQRPSTRARPQDNPSARAGGRRKRASAASPRPVGGEQTGGRDGEVGVDHAPARRPARTRAPGRCAAWTPPPRGRPTGRACRNTPPESTTRSSSRLGDLRAQVPPHGDDRGQRGHPPVLRRAARIARDVADLAGHAGHRGREQVGLHRVDDALGLRPRPAPRPRRRAPRGRLPRCARPRRRPRSGRRWWRSRRRRRAPAPRGSAPAPRRRAPRPPASATRTSLRNRGPTAGPRPPTACRRYSAASAARAGSATICPRCGSTFSQVTTVRPVARSTASASSRAASGAASTIGKRTRAPARRPALCRRSAGSSPS